MNDSLKHYEKYRKRKFLVFFFLAGLVLAMLFSVSVGPIGVPLGDVLRIVFTGTRAGTGESVDFYAIVHDVRLPRVLLAALVGAALSGCGCALQAIFRNPMASPYVIGIASGASFGAALVIVLGVGSYFIPMSAFIFALGAAFVVYYVARVKGRTPVETLLLSGIAISLFFSALVSFTQYMSGEQQLREIVFWLMGGFWKSDWSRLLLCFPPILLGLAALNLFARDLNIILLGEETAADLGIEVESVQKIILVLSALTTSAAVCMVGVIGFVGLIIPHLARIIIGPDHRILLPTSIIGGAIFLVIVDTVARTIISPTELPVGILTALLGVPFFLYLLRTRKREMGW